MSNVRFDCPEAACGTRAYLPPGNPDQLRCPQHKVLYEQTDETPGSVFDPRDVERLTEDVVMKQMPTSPDAVTNDGDVVGDLVGIPSPGHGDGGNVLPADTAAVTDSEGKASRGTSSQASDKPDAKPVAKSSSK